MNRIAVNIRETILPATLNSYSVIFFFNNRFFAVILFIATFFNIIAGLCGLIAALTAVVIADRMGYDKFSLRQGIFSFNALLAGIGLGTFYEPGLVFFALLIMAALISLIISVALNGLFGKYGLPFLSIPFVITLWILMLPSGQLSNIGLTQRNVFWINEMYSIGGKPLLVLFQTIDNLPLNRIVTIYLRSLSSIIFQDNLITGIVIAFAIFITSRITFLLTILGFISAYLFAHFIGADMASLSYYNIGANYILFSIAVGGFFIIPSRYSYFWAILLVPVLSMIILFLRNIPGLAGLPLLSLPFSVMSILFLYFLGLRVSPGKLKTTIIQHYLPEINLYTYINNSDRLTGSKYFPIHLPFWGEWTVNQGYNGEYTHKGEWENALDMILTDESARAFSSTPYQNENYYCFNKPVIAPADGTVSEIIDNVVDNEPGKVNTKQNWGNTVVLKHADNFYTQISHLKKGSIKKKKGDFVRNGELLAMCGNSGRSPEPHLHFQVQATPLPGSKTIQYPFSYYLLKQNNKYLLKSYSIPSEDDKILNVANDPLLKSSFDFQPGMILRFSYMVNDSDKKESSWEVFTDAYNNKYIFCSDTRSYAYFINDGTMFYFTSFYGDHKSLLFHFYITAYKILLGNYPGIEVDDILPLHIIRRNNFSMWLHDLVAPIHQYLKIHYKSRIKSSNNTLNPDRMQLEIQVSRSVFRKLKTECSGNIILSDNKISEFIFENSNYRIWAQNKDI